VLGNFFIVMLLIQLTL